MWSGRAWLEEGQSKTKTGEAMSAAPGSLGNPGIGGNTHVISVQEKPLAQSEAPTFMCLSHCPRATIMQLDMAVCLKVCI